MPSVSPVAPGNRYGRLVVIQEAPRRPNRTEHRHWECRCDCGKTIVVEQYSLRTDVTRSCGCLRSENSTRMGKARKQANPVREHPLYRVWGKMMQRCYRPETPHFDHYGGRGIAVCEHWHTFENFAADMPPRPSPEHSIDRIENDRGYSCGHCPACLAAGHPANVRWADRETQQSNRSNNHRIEFGGEDLTVSQWARRLGCNVCVITGRLAKGWSIEDALTRPVRPKKPNGA